ncbi:hypothetical protein [Bartonella rattaustraliani]|uniref:hypothetical protein n=1 Tax=Bartonella rattaustraliani TaxID=481139 RepID=UPI0003619E24|nr:hypothetical protein [Bartonella rattaustraliani]
MDRGLTNAMADHFGQYMQNMTQANAVLGDLNKYRLGMVGNLLPAYNNAYSNALQGSSLLDDYNQRLIDADRERWLEQDNSGWNRLNMLMNAARGFAGNYGQTMNKSIASLMPGNDPWRNALIIGGLALEGAKNIPFKW